MHDLSKQRCSKMLHYTEICKQMKLQSPGLGEEEKKNNNNKTKQSANTLLYCLSN